MVCCNLRQNDRYFTILNTLEIRDFMHVGQNIAKLRSFKGIKQDDMANRLGISQQAYSKIEQSEEVERGMLHEVARVLECSEDIIRNIGNSPLINTENQSGGNNVIGNLVNPIDKIIELYERMLETEHSKVKLLEELLKKKQ